MNEAMLIGAIAHAENHCQKYFGKKHIPLGQLQRHSRGSVNLPVSGGPDVMAALSASQQKDGTLRARAGDSYIELVRFSEAGVEIESVHAFGASAKPNSPHYTDQMPMFAQKKWRQIESDLTTIRQTATRIYSPHKPN